MKRQFYTCLNKLQQTADSYPIAYPGVQMSLERNIYVSSHSVKNFQTKLDVHGNNIANVSTVGFKQGRMQTIESFHEQLHNAIETNGATSQLSPREGGFGQARPNLYIDPRSGILQATGNALDLAIEGDGYFMVERNGKKLFTRDGNFALDVNKSLVMEGSSAFLLGWVGQLQPDGSALIDTTKSTERLSLDALGTLPSLPTSFVNFASNLNSDTEGKRITMEKDRTIVTDANRNEQEYGIRFTRSGKDSFDLELTQNGSMVARMQSTFDVHGKSLGFQILQTADGVQTKQNVNGELTGLTWTYPSPVEDAPDATLTREFTLPDWQTFDESGSQFVFQISDDSGSPHSFLTHYQRGGNHTTSTEIVDSAGISHPASFVFENMNDNESNWEYRVYLDKESAPVQSWLQANGIDADKATPSDYERANDSIFGTSRTGRLAFDNEGLIDATRSHTPRLTGTLVSAGVTGTVNTELNMALVTGFDAPFSTGVRERNGYVQGELIRSTVSSTGDGKIFARFTNGEERALGQIAIGVFTNAAGLVRDGNNMFRAGINAGEDNLTVNIPNSGRRGLIRPRFLELSNVNLLEEFTQLIITQRSLQANSKIITTADNLLNTGINIKR